MKKTILSVVATLVLTLSIFSGEASMADCFIGEVKMFAGNFAPRGYALTEGQLLPISQHQALFSILGTTYGGDGRTTFGLPDLKGRSPAGPGTGAGLSPVRLGERLGTKEIQTDRNHQHLLAAVKIKDGSANNATTGTTKKRLVYAESDVAEVELSNATSAVGVGGAGTVSNYQPSLGLNFIICIQGIFPSRS